MTLARMVAPGSEALMLSLPTPWLVAMMPKAPWLNTLFVNVNPSVRPSSLAIPQARQGRPRVAGERGHSPDLSPASRHRVAPREARGSPAAGPPAQRQSLCWA